MHAAGYGVIQIARQVNDGCALATVRVLEREPQSLRARKDRLTGRQPPQATTCKS